MIPDTRQGLRFMIKKLLLVIISELKFWHIWVEWWESYIVSFRTQDTEVTGAGIWVVKGTENKTHFIVKASFI